MNIAVPGVDFAKIVCSPTGLDAPGALVLPKRIQHFRLLGFPTDLSRCIVAMVKACGLAHHSGRFCIELGHEPWLMSALYVRPYVKVHKTDDRRANGIAAAATRPTMNFVVAETEEQLDLQASRRFRDCLINSRTRLINQARGLLSRLTGLVFYVVSSVNGVSARVTIMGTLPFMVPLLVALLIGTFAPSASLWLPSLLGF